MLLERVSKLVLLKVARFLATDLQRALIKLLDFSGVGALRMIECKIVIVTIVRVLLSLLFLLGVYRVVEVVTVVRVLVGLVDV